MYLYQVCVPLRLVSEQTGMIYCSRTTAVQQHDCSTWYFLTCLSLRSDASPRFLITPPNLLPQFSIYLRDHPSWNSSVWSLISRPTWEAQFFDTAAVCTYARISFTHRIVSEQTGTYSDENTERVQPKPAKTAPEPGSSRRTKPRLVYLPGMYLSLIVLTRTTKWYFKIFYRVYDEHK